MISEYEVWRSGGGNSFRDLGWQGGYRCYDKLG